MTLLKCKQLNVGNCVWIRLGLWEWFEAQREHYSCVITRKTNLKVFENRIHHTKFMMYKLHIHARNVKRINSHTIWILAAVSQGFPDLQTRIFWKFFWKEWSVVWSIISLKVMHILFYSTKQTVEHPCCLLMELHIQFNIVIEYQVPNKKESVDNLNNKLSNEIYVAEVMVC